MALTQRTTGSRPSGGGAMAGWFLESLIDGGKRLRVPIYPLPFLIGRRLGLDLTLPADSVSKEHAEIYEHAGILRVRDLESTNGTFVARKRVKDVPLHEGDILHFAEFEFRLGRRERRKEIPVMEPDERSTVKLAKGPTLPHELEGVRELEDLLRAGAIEPLFEPIVSLPGGAVAGYEATGRGIHPDLPENLGALLEIALSVGLESDLSRLVRRRALERVGMREDLPTVFLTLHPRELVEARLLKSVRELRSLAPHLPLALELHGDAFDNPRSIAELRACLYELRISLAYDDFSTTPTRLVELAESPPDYVKFDSRLVRGIAHAPASKRRLLTSLVSTAHDLQVRTVACGVETPAEAETCIQIGFTHAQGPFYGGPVHLDPYPPA